MISLEHLKSSLMECLKEKLLFVKTEKNELTIGVLPKDLIKSLCLLRDLPELNFRQLIDICGVDYPGRDKRFDVVYHLLSLKQNARVRIKVQVDENETIPSCSSVYPCANWWEREVWDMFGIPFTEHPDLRRLLTDYGFEGHPLRKDFPLSGYVEVRYDEEQKRVVNEPVKLQQEFRTFDFLSPWEGNSEQGFSLPGDEKALNAAPGFARDPGPVEKE